MELDADDPRLGLEGLAQLWSDSDGRWTPLRMPKTVVGDLHPDLEPLVRMAPGARYAFRSDATHLRVNAETLPSTVGRAVTTPFDVLVDGRLELRADPHLGEPVELDGIRPNQAVEIWLPQYGLPRLGTIELDASWIEPSTTDGPRWTVYGSSISQCRLSNGPSETWPALVAREHGWRLRNLAMSGQAHLDPSIARYIRDSPADIITICIGINIFNAGSFTERTLGAAVLGFLRTVRDGHPSTPLVVMTSIASPEREKTPNAVGLTLEQIRLIVRNAAGLLQDGATVVLDGTSILGLSDAHLLADGLHPSHAGYRMMAERLSPYLAAVSSRGGANK